MTPLKERIRIALDALKSELHKFAIADDHAICVQVTDTDAYCQVRAIDDVRRILRGGPWERTIAVIDATAERETPVIVSAQVGKDACVDVFGVRRYDPTLN